MTQPLPCVEAPLQVLVLGSLNLFLQVLVLGSLNLFLPEETKQTAIYVLKVDYDLSNII